MRALLLLAATATFALPAVAEAQNVYQTHFAGSANSGCFLRNYDTAHLASHPDQWVTSMMLTISPLSSGGNAPILELFVTRRGDDYNYHARAYCQFAGDALSCQLANDAGAFTVVGQKNRRILLESGPDGLSFQGSNAAFTLSGTTGDDRSFLLRSMSSDMCN